LGLQGAGEDRLVVRGVGRSDRRRLRRDGDVRGLAREPVAGHRGVCDGAAVLDAASDEPSTYQSPTDDDIIDASTVHNLDPAALDLNFDEPSTYNDEAAVGGGGGGVESGNGTVRDSSVRYGIHGELDLALRRDRWPTDRGHDVGVDR
jgi:hypothetical protein